MPTQNTEQNLLLQCDRLEISGYASSRPARILAQLFGLALVFLTPVGWAFVYKAGFEEDAAMFWVLVGIAAPVFGTWLSAGHYQYLDMKTGTLVNEKYWFFSQRQEETPLSAFAKIVVRHLCHPGGEGEDTFTGSVGLKPVAGGPVVWVKAFPATRDEMSAEPEKFARELAARIGLPYADYSVSQIIYPEPYDEEQSRH